MRLTLFLAQDRRLEASFRLMSFDVNEENSLCTGVFIERNWEVIYFRRQLFRQLAQFILSLSTSVTDIITG